jgi:hypothetical protein
MDFLYNVIVVSAHAVDAEISVPETHELFLAELPSDIAHHLRQFSRSAEKVLPLAPDSAKLWHSFVIAAFRARVVVDGQRLVEWFVHEGWERGAAVDLNRRFFEQCRLLSQFAEEVTVA